MHPRVQKKYFSTYLVLRVGNYEEKGKRHVEFLDKDKIIQEIKELDQYVVPGYTIRVFNVRLPDSVMYDSLMGVFKILDE